MGITCRPIYNKANTQLGKVTGGGVRGDNVQIWCMLQPGTALHPHRGLLTLFTMFPITHIRDSALGLTLGHILQEVEFNKFLL